jgi:hypothetical protein
LTLPMLPVEDLKHSMNMTFILGTLQQVLYL